MIGYKCFNEDLTNRYGAEFKVGKTYHVSGNIKFGNDGNGFHMCKNMEDTLRYFDAFNGNVRICLVYGFGKSNKYNDEYNGFYDNDNILKCIKYYQENMEDVYKLEK